MSVTLLKCLLPLACAVHLALLYCDRIITLLDGGRFDFRLLNNKKLSAVMGATPTERPMRSMVLGAFAMTAAMPAYLALGAWVLPQSPVCGALMLADGILFFAAGRGASRLLRRGGVVLSPHEQDRGGAGRHRGIF